MLKKISEDTIPKENMKEIFYKIRIREMEVLNKEENVNKEDG